MSLCLAILADDIDIPVVDADSQGPENKEDWDKVVVPALNFVGKYIQA